MFITAVRDSFYILSCIAFLVNNFFQLFSISFSLFQRRPLKLISVLSNRCCRVQQPWILYTLPPQKSTTFFIIFSKQHFDQNAQLFLLFLCTLYTLSFMQKGSIEKFLYRPCSLPFTSYLLISEPSPQVPLTTPRFLLQTSLLQASWISDQSFLLYVLLAMLSQLLLLSSLPP